MSGRTEAAKRHRLGPIRTRPHPVGSPGKGVFEGNFGFLPPEFVWEKSLDRHFHGLWAPTGTTIGPKENFFGHCEIGKNPPRKDIERTFLRILTYFDGPRRILSLPRPSDKMTKAADVVVGPLAGRMVKIRTNSDANCPRGSPRRGPTPTLQARALYSGCDGRSLARQ